MATEHAHGRKLCRAALARGHRTIDTVNLMRPRRAADLQRAFSDTYHGRSADWVGTLWPAGRIKNRQGRIDQLLLYKGGAFF